MNDLISVIVPIFNAENFLDRCINSIIEQTYSLLELILVDDGSEDKSGEICSIWEHKDARIKYYRQYNSGVSAARNLGLERASGAFVVFIDADDYVEKTFLATLIGAQEKTQADIVVSNAVDVYDDGKTVTGVNLKSRVILEQKDAAYHFFKQDIYTPVCWARLYKRSCIENIRFNTAMRIAEDGDFFWNAIKCSHLLCVIPENLYYYYIHSSSVMHSGFTSKYYDELYFCDRLIENTVNEGERLSQAAKKKKYLYIIRLLKMNGLTQKDKNYLREQLKISYKDVKMNLKIKEKIAYYIFWVKKYV